MYCLCRPSKTITLRIILLDENDFLQDIQDNLPGQAILDTIFSRLNLIETAYFGVRFVDEDGQTHWLDPAVRISRQLKGSKDPFELYFGVKFYAADPCKLIEEITRYQLYLQVKQDVLQGRLPVAFELAAELGAYVVQAELGDYDSRKHAFGYVSEFRLLSNQTRDLEQRICELHQQLKGINPSQAELNYLDKVKWNDMYGVDLHPVLGEDSVEYFLGLTPSGIVVLRNKTTVAHYYWPRIAKVYFKGRYFMLRVCDKNNEVSTYGFETPRKSACKHLWKCCVEHHAFFRLVRVSPMQPQAGDLFALGSRFRYSGRTEKQAVKDAMSMGRNQPSFKRTPSRRQARRMLEESGAVISEKHYDKLRPEIKTISIPQPANNFDSPYRSTCSIPANLNLRHNNNHSLNNNDYARPNNSSSRAPDSPRSTKSAPWMRSQQRGLFGITSSPKSVRSASALGGNNSSSHRMRSSSVESRSSIDSKSGKRHRRKSRRTSDNESELSRDSTRSGRSHNSHRKHRRHRSKHRRNDSASENDSVHGRKYSNHHMSDAHSAELIDSNQQWREVQRRQTELVSKSAVQQASVMKSNQIASSHGPDYHTHRSRKHRKHRSPSERGTKAWSNELARHLQFDLVDTTGMSEDQLREIPYTVVETAHAAKRSNFNSLKVHKTSQNVDRVDRIRSICSNDVDQNGQVVDGSIRSASTLSSSRDYDRNSGLVRMMSSLSMGDFISPSTSSLSPLDSAGLRVSHEHTDSGLGADQDYAYSSERSSDSAKYGTNKSSGASVTSGGGSGGNRSLNNTNHHNMNNNNHLKSSNPYASSALNNHFSVSNRKPPMCPMARHQQPKLNNAVPTVHNFTTNANISNLSNNNNNNIHNHTSAANSTNNHSIISYTTATNNNNINNSLLQNNLVFENNRYTFSLNRCNSGGNGGPSLETQSQIGAPVISNSVYGDGSYIKTTRGTKSDIGVSVRKKSSCHKHSHKSHSHNHDRSNHFDSNFNFNSKSNSYKSAYCISGKSTVQTDYLENYKAATQFLYLQQQQHQLEQAQSLANATDCYVDEHGQSSYVYYKDYQQQTAKVQSPNSAPMTGPLVYLEQLHGTDQATVHSIGTNDHQQQQQQQQRRPPESKENKKTCSDGLSGLSSMENILHKRTTTSTSVSTTASTTEHSNKLQTNRSSSLDLILTPLIQSRRVQ